MFTVARSWYAAIYGPTEGDRIRLADTNLFARVEKNMIPVGEEGLIGAGKNLRDGMLFRPSNQRESEIDICIKSAVLIDPVLGVVRGDIGIKDGRIVGVGYAGNPDIQDGVEMELGTNTGAIVGNGLIATPGAIDTHVHLIGATLFETFMANGYTTLIGGSAGPMFDVGANPRYVLERMFESWQEIPINMAFLGRASSQVAPLEHALEWGVSGFKIHEDFGAYPAVIDNTLNIGDQYDVQVIIHTDTINESLSLEDTVEAIADRTIHAYHVEGAGGGHAPDMLEILSHSNVLASSTNPTNPYTESAAREHLDMIMRVHLMNPLLAEDVAFAQSRVRPETMAAEDVLHDLGAISMMGSDSLGMGHAGESVRRTWQLADTMKARLGEVTEDDNERIRRYMAKYTINPAITHGISDHVGSLEPGKLADVILWRPGWFGVKPEMVIKSGIIIYANAGHGNGCTPAIEPTALREMFGRYGGAPQSLGRLFVSGAAMDNAKLHEKVGSRRLVPVKGTRKLRKADMVHNGACPDVRVDKDSFKVFVDGSEAWVDPVERVPLNKRYLLV